MVLGVHCPRRLQPACSKAGIANRHQEWLGGPYCGTTAMLSYMPLGAARKLLAAHGPARYRAVQPPSIERQAPVMAAASSVHRCRTSAPICTMQAAAAAAWEVVKR